MDVRSAVVGRRNIKQFRPDPIDEAQLLSWFDAARFAPNHRMTEPWEIRMIGPETRAKLNHKANFGDAPTVFAVISKSAETAHDRDENLIACACFVQNFLLIAHEAGVGVRWASLGALPVNRAILEVPDGDAVVGVFGIGYPVEVPGAKPRASIREKLRVLS